MINQPILLKLNHLIEGSIQKRPSQYIKSPYVADINMDGVNNTVLSHTASLGCCGLCEKGSTILMTPLPKNNKKIKENKLYCEYRVYLSIIREKENEIIVGIYPKLAEQLTEKALQYNLFSKLKNIKSYKKETKIYVPNTVDSRFDFSGIDQNGTPFILEVKNVPLADYEDVTAKDRKKMNFDNRDVSSKVAYFPDGYRKKTNDPVSPRALKHINELTYIKQHSKTRCIMCYIIQRNDVANFTPSIIDPHYRNAFINAINNGVEIITMVVQWTKKGVAYFIRDDLPIVI